MFRRTVIAVSLGALLVPAAALAAAKLSDTAAPHALADKAAPLPIKATFEKNAAAKTEGPFVLTLTNTSDKPLMVTALVDVSVAIHDRPKNRELGPREITPGQNWKIDDLVAEDRVTVKAEGFEPLKLVVK
jgi:hypothetical protein